MSWIRNFHLSRKSLHRSSLPPTWWNTLHLRASMFTVTIARRHREPAVVGIFKPIYCCEECLRIQGIFTMYLFCPARPRWGKNDRCTTRPGESFFGRVPAFGTCPGSHWPVRCCTTALRSPCRHFSMERDRATRDNSSLLH